MVKVPRGFVWTFPWQNSCCTGKGDNCIIDWTATGSRLAGQKRLLRARCCCCCCCCSLSFFPNLLLLAPPPTPQLALQPSHASRHKPPGSSCSYIKLKLGFMASDAPSTTSPPPLAGPTQATTTEQSSGHLISSPARSLSRIWERIAGPGSPQPRVATDALDRALSTDASDDSLTNDEDESADDDTTSLSGIEVGRSRRLVDTGALPIDVLGRFGPGASPPSSAQRTSASWDRFRPTRWGMSNRNSNREDLDDPQLSFFVHSNLAQALNTAGPASRFHGTNEDCALPLDNEEGVVVDDEACFVDGWEGRVGASPRCGAASHERDVLTRQSCSDFLSSLPHEISLYILLHLDFRSLLVASSVSRQWHGLAGDNILWRDLFHREQRWTIREPAEDDSRADFFDSVPFSSPASPLKRVASSLGRPAVKRPILTREPSSSGARLGRRLSDMLPDLGSLSLTRTTSTASATAVSAPIADGGSPAPTPVTPRRPSAATISRASAANATFTIGTLASAVSPTSPFTLSRNNSSSALASLASSISSLPPSRGPSRRASSATLPPLGPVPSPSLHMTPSAPLFLDWPRLYRDRFTLDQRWSKGRPRSTWLKGHTDSVYCLQFDAHKVISGSVGLLPVASNRSSLC